MKKEIVFATNNENKAQEVELLLGQDFEIKTLRSIGCFEDIPETADTLDGNSKLKAQYVFENYNINCFADDTGLEVESLNGEPGVYSARYAGPQKDSEDNMDLLLQRLEEHTNRKARFRTVISLVVNGVYHTFEGIASGIITTEKSGAKGFGYDPIFQPDGYDKTFAEMTHDEKNRISHRGIAVRKLVDFLKEL